MSNLKLIHGSCADQTTDVIVNAVITSACKMKNAKFIIHAVGPDFRITPTAFLELFNAYYNSLILLKIFRIHIRSKCVRMWLLQIGRAHV